MLAFLMAFSHIGQPELLKFHGIFYMNKQKLNYFQIETQQYQSLNLQIAQGNI